MPTFNYQKAIEAGYSPEEIDAFVKQNKLSVRKPAQSAPVAPQPQMEVPEPQIKPQSLNERIGQGVFNIGKQILSPFARTGKNIAGGLIQAPLAIRAGDLANVVNDPNASDEDKDKALKELRRVNQLNKLLAPFAETGKATDSYKKTAGEVLSSPEVSKQVRDSINVASYGVPFGKGANILTRAVLPGAAVGALQEASQEGATASSIAGGAVTGGALSGGAYAATKIPSLIRSFGKGAEKTGTKIIQSQYNLPRSSADNLKLPETVKTLSQYGINSTDDVLSKSDEIISLLEKPVQKSVSGAKPVKLDGFTETVKSIVDDPSIRTGQDEKILKFVDKLIQKVTKNGKGSQITFEGDPNSVLETIRTLQKKAADVARGKLPGQISDEERALKQAYNLIADELEDRLFQTAGADKLVQGSVPEIIDALKKFSPKLAEDASKAKTVGELRSLMAPFVRGKQAAQITEIGQNLATETMGGAVRGVAKAIPSLSDPLAPARFIADQPAVNAAVGSGIRRAGESIQRAPQTPQSVSNIASAVAPRLPALAGESTTPQPTMTEETPEPTTMEFTPQEKENPRDIPGPSGYSYNDLTRAYAIAMMEGDSKLANRIKGVLELEKENLPKESTGQGTATERLNKNRATIGLRALADAEKLLKEDPNLLVKGLLPGKLLSRKYENAAVRAAEQILRMQTGAVVSKDEARRYAQDFMPWIGDDPETIQYKLEQMRLDYEQFL